MQGHCQKESPSLNLMSQHSLVMTISREPCLEGPCLERVCLEGFCLQGACLDLLPLKHSHNKALKVAPGSLAQKVKIICCQHISLTTEQ